MNKNIMSTISSESSRDKLEENHDISISNKNVTSQGFIRNFLGRLIVKPIKKVGYIPLITFYICSMFTITLLVFNSANTVYVLNVFLKSPKNVQGRQSGDLAFVQEIVILIMSLFWGIFSDYFGRAIVFSIGFLNIAVAIILSSWTTRIEFLFGARIYFATGAAACTSMMTAILRDYVVKGDRGKGGGMLGFVSGLGAVIAALLFLRFSTWVQVLLQTNNEVLNGRIVYLGVGIFAIIMSIAALLFLKSPRRQKWYLFSRLHDTEAYPQEPIEENSMTEKDEQKFEELSSNIHLASPIPQRSSWSNSIFMKVKEFILHAWNGVLAIRDPSIFLSYCAAFVARSDSILVTSFLTLWVSLQMHTENPGISDAQAVARGGMISGICQLAALLTAPFWGLLADRFNHPFALTLAALFSCIGYSSMGLLTSVTHGWVFLPIILIGIGEIGVIIIAQGLLARSVPGEVTGVVSGIFTFVGGLGILSTTKLGGWIFDKYSPAYLFYIFGVMNWTLAVISFIIVLITFFKRK